MIETVLPPKRPGDLPVWIDVLDPSAEELDALAEQYALPRASLEECTAARHLPQHERLDTTNFIITRVYDEDSRPDAHAFLDVTRKLAIFQGEHFLVTVHSRPLPFLETIKARVRGSKKHFALPSTVIEILLAGVETFHAPLERAELLVHDFEASVLEEASSSDIAWKDVFRTKVRIQTYKRLLWHVQNLLQKHSVHAAPARGLALDLRERVASLLFLAESLDDDLDNLLNVQLSLSASRTNDVVRVLTLFSAFFLPITFIVGVYGMNFEHMPELRHRYGYGGTWLVILGTCAGIYAWFRRQGWMR